MVIVWLAEGVLTPGKSGSCLGEGVPNPAERAAAGETNTSADALH